MTTNTNMENTFSTADNLSQKANGGNTDIFDSMALLKEFPKITRSTDSTASDCFVNFQVDRQLDKSQFKKELGDEAAKFLDSIGCNKITINGDNVNLSLDRPASIPVGQATIKNVELDKNVDLKINRQNGEVSISDVRGVQINPSILPRFSVPDLKIRPDGIDIPYVPGRIAAPGLYDQLKDIAERLGR